jgi:hypothetical protein
MINLAESDLTVPWGMKFHDKSRIHPDVLLFVGVLTQPAGTDRDSILPSVSFPLQQE